MGRGIGVGCEDEGEDGDERGRFLIFRCGWCRWRRGRDSLGGLQGIEIIVPHLRLLKANIAKSGNDQGEEQGDIFHGEIMANDSPNHNGFQYFQPRHEKRQRQRQQNDDGPKGEASARKFSASTARRLLRAAAQVQVVGSLKPTPMASAISAHIKRSRN